MPLAKAGVVADAMDADAGYVLRLALEEYEPEVWMVVAATIGDECL